MVDPNGHDSGAPGFDSGAEHDQSEGINSDAIVRGCAVAIIVVLLLCCGCCGANYYFGR